MKKASNFVFVTGVSSGIGNSITKSLLKKGFRVIGTIRNEKDKATAQTSFGENFYPVITDITNADSVKEAIHQCHKILAGSGLGGLINNAGVALGGPIADMSMDDIKLHFEVNVFGLLQITKAFLPLLGVDENHPDLPGKIINITSVAGKFAAPFLGPYAGSKYAIEGISDSLRRELLPYGIDVIVVGPGNVITPIWDKGINLKRYEGSKFYNTYKNFAEYAVNESASGHTADEMGDLIANVFTNQKPKARYAFVKGRLKNWIIPRMIPTRMMDKMIGKQLGTVK